MLADAYLCNMLAYLMTRAVDEHKYDRNLVHSSSIALDQTELRALRQCKSTLSGLSMFLHHGAITSRYGLLLC
jgi:hypothetical protein